MLRGPTPFRQGKCSGNDLMISRLTVLILSLLFVYGIVRADTPGLGLNLNNSSPAVSVGDYNLFDQEYRHYSFLRYGGGGGRFSISANPNNFDISLDATGGAFLRYDKMAILDWVWGIEGAAGSLVANSSRAYESYYTWLPAAMVGLKLSLGEFTLIVGPKAGGYLGNLGNTGLTPDASYSYGYDVELNILGLGVEYVNTTLTRDRSFKTFSLLYDRLILRFNQVRGLKEEANYLLLWRM